MSYPPSWKVSKLGSIVDVRDGTHESPKYVEKGVPFVTSKNLKGNSICFNNVSYISEEDHADFSRRSGVESGDILFGMIGTIGNTAIVNTDTEFSIKNVALLKLANNQEVLTGFIFYILNSSVIRKQFARLSNSGVQSFVSLSMIRGLSIPLPPIEEQKKITKVLSTADKKIDLIEQKISETQQLKKGLMQKLFSEGVGEINEKREWLPHTEFQDSVYGSIPAVWAISQLNEVLSYVDYRGKTPPKVESGVFLVTAKNVKNGYIDYEASKEYIPKALYDEVMSRGTPKLGDVLFTTEAPMGNIALVDDQDVAIAQRIIKFRPKSWRQLNNVYLKYFFLSPEFKKELDFNGTGSTVKGIKGKRLHVMKIAIPPIKEQIKIARILSTVDKKIDLLNQQKAEAQQLKKGLMQKLLTGEWRVPLDDQAA